MSEADHNLIGIGSDAFGLYTAYPVKILGWKTANRICDADHCTHFDGLSFEIVAQPLHHLRNGPDCGRVTEQLGRPPARYEMNADSAYSATAYRNEFGSWCNAIRSIGISQCRKSQSSTHP